MKDELKYIVEIINMSEKLPAYDFNFNSDVRKVYCIVYDDESLKKSIERETLLDANRIYSIDYALKNYIENNQVAVNLANEYINKIENYHSRNWLKNDLVKYAIGLNEIEIAEKVTSEIPDDDNSSTQYLAHRHILEFYASKGDIENFKIKTKPSKLAKFPRLGIESYKYKLIEGYAKNNGLEKAFNLITDKYFEKTDSISILKWTAHLLNLSEINKILINHPRVEIDSRNAKAELYVLHYREKDAGDISKSDFENTLNEVLKVNKDTKHGDLRLRDSLLIDLGASTLNKTQALECKKNIISPISKRELNYVINFNVENKKYIS